MSVENVIALLQDDRFSAATLTEAVNRSPKVHKKIKSMGLFEIEGINTSSIVVDIEEGGLSVMPQTTRGGPATMQKPISKSATVLLVPNFKKKAILGATDLQNVVDGSEKSLSTLSGVIAKSSRRLNDDMEITHEFLMAMALRGKVVDIEGNEIVDLFDKFGKTQTTINFNFGDDGDVIGTTDSVDTAIDEALGNDTKTGVLVLCSTAFWNAMLKNKAIFEIYKNRQVGPNPLINDLRDGFEFQGCVFVKYTGSVMANGTKIPFVPDGEAIALPLGTRNTFKMYVAPADLLEFANTEGVEKYLTVSYEKHDGEDQVVVRAETDPLPICNKPDVLLRLTYTDGEAQQKA